MSGQPEVGVIPTAPLPVTGGADDGQCDGANGIGAHHFQAVDYAVFGVVISISAVIGVFVGCIRGRSSTASAFLVGNRSMHFLPVALSMILGHASSVAVLGNPSEMYTYGGQLYVLCLAFLVGGPLSTWLFLPVYENLRITSINEYLKLRFNSVVGMIYSFIFVIQALIHNGLSLYAPSLALAQVTNLNVYVIVAIVFSVCVFYASIGGIRAIVWSDALMFVILLCSVVGLMVMGTELDGGLGTVWDDNLGTGRLQIFQTDPGINKRYTVWSVFIGGIFYWAGLTSVNQASVQRLLTMPNYREATKCIWMTAIGNLIIYTVLFYLGMMIYSYYKDCDPISSKMVRRSDQLVPLYVMDVMQSYPGMAGLFIACVFGTSIGSSAAMLNGMAAVTLRDFVIGVMRRNLTDVQAGTLSKIMSVAYGVASLAFLAVISQTGGMMETNLSLTGLVIGIALGEFLLGMFFPWANWKGVTGGLVVSIALMTWLSWDTSAAVKEGRLVYTRMPVSVDGCPCNATVETPDIPLVSVSPILQISTMWYSLIGLVLFLVISIIISGLTGFQDPRELDQTLISPVAKSFFNKLPPSAREFLKLPIYESKDPESSKLPEGVTTLRRGKIYSVRL